MALYHQPFIRQLPDLGAVDVGLVHQRLIALIGLAVAINVAGRVAFALQPVPDSTKQARRLVGRRLALADWAEPPITVLKYLVMLRESMTRQEVFAGPARLEAIRQNAIVDALIDGNQPRKVHIIAGLLVLVPGTRQHVLRTAKLAHSQLAQDLALLLNGPVRARPGKRARIDTAV